MDARRPIPTMGIVDSIFPAARLAGLALGAACIACMACAPALAQQSLTGSQLAGACDQADKIFSSAGSPGGQELTEAYRCLAFVSGVMQGMLAGSPSARLVCARAPVPDVQVMRVTLAWLKKHPQSLHKPAGVLTASAIRDAFPCR
jgi:hypothetical protein